jgi:hypothetical protein
MNSRIQFTTPTRSLAIALVLLCFDLLPQTQAVSPPPDGGYPGNNTAEGTFALSRLTTGISNTALGQVALFNNTIGSYNTGAGFKALYYTSNGSQNTATGKFAMSFNNSIGSFNTANGVSSLGFNTTGSNNTAVGMRALGFNFTGSENTAVGVSALGLGNNLSSQNTAIGFKTLLDLFDGNDNVTLGYEAGSELGRDALYNIDLGNTGQLYDNNIIRIGDVQTATFMAGIRGANVLGDAVPVIIDANGQLGTASSSRRFKREIEPIDKASEAILALKPVTFHYKSDTTNTPQFGLIAEEVADVNPGLIVRDKNDEIYTVRYDAVNAMLLNEFLKEHRKIEEQAGEMQQQQATIAELTSDGAKEDVTISEFKKQMESVVARLNEHDSRIQKASAQMELGKSLARTALNTQ